MGARGRFFLRSLGLPGVAWASWVPLVSPNQLAPLGCPVRIFLPTFSPFFPLFSPPRLRKNDGIRLKEQFCSPSFPGALEFSDKIALLGSPGFKKLDVTNLVQYCFNYLNTFCRSPGGPVCSCPVSVSSRLCPMIKLQIYIGANKFVNTTIGVC